MLMREEVRFKKEVRKRIYDELERSGFNRFSKEGVDLPLNGDFHCWVGLNTAVYEGVVQINPFVGIHAVSIEKVAASLKGRKYDRGIATYAVAMGEIDAAKNERAFDFPLGCSDALIDSEVHRISKIYDDFGIPFSASIASYDDLVGLLKDRVDMLGGYPESFACCLYLMGNESESREFVEEFSSVEPEYFGPFAEKFMDMIYRNR